MTSLIEEAGEWEEKGNYKREAPPSIGGERRRRVGVVPSSFSDDYAIDQKVKRACKGLLPGTLKSEVDHWIGWWSEELNNDSNAAC